MKWTFADTVGLLISLAITMIPFVYLVMCFGGMFWGDFKHPRQIRLEECKTPIAVAFGMAVVTSTIAVWTERGSSEPEHRQYRRVFTHAALAVASLIILCITFFFGWGKWVM